MADVKQRRKKRATSPNYKRLQALKAINDQLQQVVSQGLNIDIVLPEVLRTAMDEVGAFSGSIIVVDTKFEIQHNWLISGWTGEDGPSDFLNQAVKEGLFGWAVRNRRSALIPDTRKDSRWLPQPGYDSSTEPWSAICVPMNMRERSIGAITMTRPGEQQFSQDDMELLAAIANQAAITIESARLFEQSQRQLRVTALLSHASQVINSSLEAGQILQSLLTQANELLNADAISIALYDRQSDELVYEVAEGPSRDKIIGIRIPSRHGVSGWVIHHAASALIPDTSLDSRFHAGVDQQTGYSTRAIICAPIVAQEEVLGAIEAISPMEGQFSRDDLKLLTNLANLASSALANARQFERVRAAETRYLNLFEDSISPILLTDAQGRIVEANRQAYEVLGYQQQELVGSSILQLHDSEHESALPSTKELDAIGPHNVHRIQTRLRRKDGPMLWVEVHVKQIVCLDERLLQWIYHDISQQVELDNAREELTAMLVHDLQSPLGNIISSLELLRLELSGEASTVAGPVLDIALRSSQRLQGLIRSILDINHLEAGYPITNLDYFDLVVLISEAIEIVSPNLDGRRIQVKVAMQDDLPAAYCEEEMIRRVLVNLLDNSAKYSPRDTTITLSASHTPGKEQLHISVSDQGSGVAPQFRQQIFQKFHRPQVGEKQMPKGVGLGLAFCRIAVEAHGGAIWVDDAPGGGARFHFTLATTPF